MQHPIQALQKLGKNTLEHIEAIGHSFVFVVLAIFAIPKAKSIKKTFPIFLKQLYFLGILSLPIILFSGLFVGMVLGLQGVRVLSLFGAQGSSGQLVVLALLRELSPAITALLFAGRSGSAITAEIGLMKTTEQLASLEIMGVNTVGRVIAPRLWASFIAIPVLAVFFTIMGVWGASLLAVDLLHVDSGEFWSNIRSATYFSDFRALIIKSAIFSILVTWTAVYQGYSCKPTAEGVAYATTRSVVYASLSVFAANLLLSALLF